MLRAIVIAMWIVMFFVLREPIRLNPIWLLPIAFTVVNRLPNPFSSHSITGSTVFFEVPSRS
jgi:hypothetical protein